MALAGAVVTAVLPVVIRWGSDYHFSKEGWHQVTKGDGLLWSALAVGLWLMLVAVWHCMKAPMSHAREVLSFHEKRHAHEIEHLREEAKNTAPPIGQYVHQQIIVASHEEAADLMERVPPVIARPPNDRPGQRQTLQAAAEQSDTIDDAGEAQQ